MTYPAFRPGFVSLMYRDFLSVTFDLPPPEKGGCEIFVDEVERINRLAFRSGFDGARVTKFSQRRNRRGGWSIWLCCARSDAPLTVIDVIDAAAKVAAKVKGARP
ncbi:MAG: hypothetical protein JKY98_05285 [Gammaproteobacteria bacterium]|nr:hypothetical protein [Gammaproteobacteria bacterium]